MPVIRRYVNFNPAGLCPAYLPPVRVPELDGEPPQYCHPDGYILVEADG